MDAFASVMNSVSFRDLQSRLQSTHQCKELHVQRAANPEWPGLGDGRRGRGSPRYGKGGNHGDSIRGRDQCLWNLKSIVAPGGSGEKMVPRFP